MDNAESASFLTNPVAWATELAIWLNDTFLEFLPNLILASIQLLLAIALAWIARWIFLRFERGLEKVLSALQLGTTFSNSRHSWPVSAIMGSVVFWIIIALGLVTASETVGLDFLANWLQELLNYIPRLLISMAILFIANLISQGLKALIQGYAHAHDLQHGPMLAQLVAGLVLTLALILALDQLGLAVDLLELIIILAFAAFFGGTALAFGMGASDSIRNIMASHYVRRQYQPGLTIRVDELEGEILELTPVAVLLDTESGQVFIPARVFMERASLILEPEEIDGH